MTRQPGPGGKVKDSSGDVWINTTDDDPFRPSAVNWERDKAAGFEPESWVRVCEYAPLVVIDPGEPY